ncbi:hypothetical protein DevBK_01915 [Devosia sp. BK]|nr:MULTISPECIES: hypothetical protein [unclassified Devosia]MDV3250080.1 hypothetical protein [Devosia sp. BK]
MSNPSVSLFVGSSTWLQHHLPWLAALALFMGLFSDEPQFDADPDDMNG